MGLLDDIYTPRLVLRLMGDEVMAACLAGDLRRAQPDESPYRDTRAEVTPGKNRAGRQIPNLPARRRVIALL
jgi:hypothetical protein